MDIHLEFLRDDQLFYAIMEQYLKEGRRGAVATMILNLPAEHMSRMMPVIAKYLQALSDNEMYEMLSKIATIDGYDVVRFITSHRPRLCVLTSLHALKLFPKLDRVLSVIMFKNIALSRDIDTMTKIGLCKYLIINNLVDLTMKNIKKIALCVKPRVQRNVYLTAVGEHLQSKLAQTQ